MSEQFMRAWAVDGKALAAAIGGKDPKLVAQACKSDLADDLREDFEDEDDDTTLEGQLTSIVDGKKPDLAEWHALRCVMLLADVLGTRVDNEITLPGRGWQELGPAFKHWKLSAVAKLWATEPAWAKRIGGGWPHVMLAEEKALPAIIDELTGFEPKSIIRTGVPESVSRFGDGGWDMESLSECIAELVVELTNCTKAARRTKRDLVLWLDGQQ